MRRFLGYIVIVVLTLGLLVILWQFREAFVLFVLSVAVAAALRPALTRLTQRGLSNSLALIITYVALVLTLLLLLVPGIRGLLTEFAQLSDDLTATYEHIATLPLSELSSFQRLIVRSLPTPEVLYRALASEPGIREAVFNLAGNAVRILADIAIILLLSLYWSADRIRFERLLLSLIPAEHRPRARQIWRELEASIGNYIASEALEGLAVLALLWVGYQLMGLRYVLILSVSGAFWYGIPWMGQAIALVPPVLVALSQGTVLTVAVAAYTLFVFFAVHKLVERNTLEQRQHSSLFVVLVALALVQSMGIFGLLFALPLAATIEILLQFVPRIWLGAELAQETSDLLEEAPVADLDDLRARLVRVEQHIAAAEEVTSPELDRLVSRLSGLMDETARLVDGRRPRRKSKSRSVVQDVA